jgi:hypothetical protein
MPLDTVSEQRLPLNGSGASRQPDYATGNPQGDDTRVARASPAEKPFAAIEPAARSLRDNGVFTSAWMAKHPDVWQPSTEVVFAETSPTWQDVSHWLGDLSFEIYYDYGGRLTVDRDAVLLDGLRVAQAPAYAEYARGLANQGRATSGGDSRWLNLGSFVAAPPYGPAELALQLVIDPAGVVRGNALSLTGDETHPVFGAINRETQRIAWCVGDGSEFVFDTGLVNLTKASAPLLFHAGSAESQTWRIARLTDS